jgi:phosphatidylglycerophosphatase A
MRPIRAAARPIKAAAKPTGLPLWLSTWFGAGLLPRAPGTFGSLAALPCAWGLVLLGGPWLLLGGTVVTFTIGLWASARYMTVAGVDDPGAICIDEVVGQWLTLMVAPLDPLAYLLGFVLFRIADIAKPWPASWADRAVGGPIGVMLDDLIAAAYAGPILFLIVQWLPA